MMGTKVRLSFYCCDEKILIILNLSVEASVIVANKKDGSFILEIDGHYKHAKGKLHSENSRNRLTASIDGRIFKSWLIDQEGTINLFTKDDCHKLCRPVPCFIKGGLSTVSQGSALAPMTGTIVKVLVGPGQHVEEGEMLVIMEAMKMEHVIRAPRAGFVDEVFYFPGEAVDRHAQLVQFRE